MAASDASGSGFGQPATHAFAVTPDDNSELPIIVRCLYVGGTGTIKVKMLSNDIVTFVAAAGGYHPIRVKQVFSTGTSATSIIGLY